MLIPIDYQKPLATSRLVCMCSFPFDGKITVPRRLKTLNHGHTYVWFRDKLWCRTGSHIRYQYNKVTNLIVRAMLLNIGENPQLYCAHKNLNLATLK